MQTVKTQADYLEHLIDVATGRGRNIPPQKATAWDMAKRYVQIDPYQLTDLPRLLTEAMQSAKSQPTLKDSASSTPVTPE